MKVWKAQKKPIVVGMRLDDFDDQLVQTAISWARKLECSIELVHSIESAIAYSNAGEVSPSSSALSPLTEARTRGSLKAMGALASDTVPIHVHVERGDPAENLNRIAREVGAGLIICGMRSQEKPWAFRGLSTTLALAFYAQVPVLILPLPMALDFEKPFSVLIADSLGGEGWHVLESGLQLARTLGCDAVYHTHVLKASARDLNATLEEMNENVRQGQLPHDLDLTPEHLVKTLEHKIQDELFYRFHNTSCSRDLLERYHPIAAIGDIDSEVNRIMSTSNTRLMIMGRHQFLSNRRLALDHIPYHALMEHKAALLVIPSYEETRSRPLSDKELTENSAAGG